MDMYTLYLDDSYGQGRTGSTLGPRATIVVGAPHILFWEGGLGPLK